MGKHIIIEVFLGKNCDIWVTVDLIAATLGHPSI